MSEMIKSGLNAIVIKVAAMGEMNCLAVYRSKKCLSSSFSNIAVVICGYTHLYHRHSKLRICL